LLATPTIAGFENADSGPTPSSDPLARVQAAIDVLVEEGSARYEFSIDVSPEEARPEQFRPFSAKGRIDLDTGRVACKLAGGPFGNARIPIRRIDATIYADFSDVAAKQDYGLFPKGTRWVSFEAEDLAEFDVERTPLLYGQFEPTSAVSALAGATGAAEAGSDQISGVETTVFELELNPRLLIDGAPPDVRDVVEARLLLFGEEPFAAQAWIDSEDQLHRVVFRFPPANLAPFAGSGAEGLLTLELTKLGAKVTVAKPPNDETQSYKDVIENFEG